MISHDRKRGCVALWSRYKDAVMEGVCCAFGTLCLRKDSCEGEAGEGARIDPSPPTSVVPLGEDDECR